MGVTVKDFCNNKIKGTYKTLSKENCNNLERHCEIEETNRIIKESCETDLQDVCKNVFTKDCEFFKREYAIKRMNKFTKDCKDKIEKKYGEEEEKAKSECLQTTQEMCKKFPLKCDEYKKDCEEGFKEDKIKSECLQTTQKMCKKSPLKCEEYKKDCEDSSRQDYDKEKEQQIKDKEQETRDDCIKKYLEVDEKGKLEIKDVLHKFYPELSSNKNIIDKIVSNAYSVKQFGMNVKNNCDNGGCDNPVTHAGGIDTDCFSNTSGNRGDFESYAIGDKDSAECRNKVLNNDTYYIEIVKVKKGGSSIDKYEPLATVSQTQPLIIVNESDGKLVTKDNTVTNIKFDKCKEFLDKDGRITDCKDKGEECNTCKEAMWDFPGEAPVYCALSS